MSSQVKNQYYTLAERPNGLPDDSCWKFVESDADKPKQGQVLVKVIYISIDPAMRGWLNDVESYIPPVQIGETMRALGVGQIIESATDDFQVGDYVSGMLGVQQYALCGAEAGLMKVDPVSARLSTYLGVLGMPGMTAYFGLLDIGEPQSGETVLISGAAGAVGAMVGQIAKLKGCRVVGVAGGEKKCDYLINTLGFDAAIDYKAVKNMTQEIATHCPDGIDIFFDNVGGEILVAAVNNISHGARLVICGAISQYNLGSSISGAIDYMPLLFKSARLQGFVVLDYVSRYAEAIEAMAGWLNSEELIPHEDIRIGLENFPDTLLMLFRGDNFGKLILKIDETA